MPGRRRVPVVVDDLGVAADPEAEELIRCADVVRLPLSARGSDGLDGSRLAEAVLSLG
ncbi:MAG: hypothetical protein ACOC5J_03260 [Gemmatimonadota bacterium]